MPTKEFLELTSVVLDDVLNAMSPEQAAIASQAEYEADFMPMPWHMAATGTPGDHNLLGMYMWEPSPKVIIFEESLKKMSASFGGLYNAVKEALVHEIYQHHFGLDHTKETVDLGYVPAFAVDNRGRHLHQWELTPRR
jgi:hypothetical protein